MQSGQIADIQHWQEANQNQRDWSDVGLHRDEKIIAQMQEQWIK